jgi:hypothetical protein
VRLKEHRMPLLQKHLSVSRKEHSYKMRTLAVIVCAVFFFSCKSEVDKKSLYGSWTLENVVNNSGNKMHDKVTFLRNDSVTIEIFVNDSLFHNYKGRYRLETNSKLLVTQLDTFPETKFEVVKLTDRNLELKRLQTNKVDRYKRL